MSERDDFIVGRIIDNAQDEIARLTARVKELEGALSDLNDWSNAELEEMWGKNADRYWQMKRIDGKIKAIRAALKETEQ